MAFCSKHLLFICLIVFVFVVSEYYTLPIPARGRPKKPSSSSSSSGTKRGGSSSNVPPAKRFCSAKKSGKRDPFQLETCSGVENIALLNTLAAVNFAKEDVYGYHKEQPELMFRKGAVCPIHSPSNDEAIHDSESRKSNEFFFSLESQRYALHRKIHAPLAQYDERNDNKNSRYRLYPNIQSCVSYFVFSVTDEVEKVIEKLNQVEWDQPFDEITKDDYQLLKSNLVYIGSGQSKRPFDHAIMTSYILGGQLFSTFQQQIHWYLAKGVRQGLFSKILVVPFFGSNNYPACVYSEQATIWALRNQTMNVPRLFETAKFKHKLCVERSAPGKYIKNCLSKQALQFVGDFNVEAGIRQISKFGAVLDFKHIYEQFDWSNQVRFKKEPYINSAFRLTKSTTQFFKFGPLESDQMAPQMFTRKQLMEDSDYFIFPFKKFKFSFTNNDWIERIRLANEITNIWNSKLSALPILLTEFHNGGKWLIDNLKNEELNQEFVENSNKQNLRNEVILSDVVNELRVFIGSARNAPSLRDTMDECQHFASQKVLMFMTSFEYLLFRKLIVDNKKLIYTGDQNYDTSQTIHDLEVPEKFVNRVYKRHSFRPRIKPPPGTSEFECPYCGRQIDPTHIRSHTESRRGEKNFECKVCRLEFSAFATLSDHENRSPSHKLLALGQFVPPHPRATVDPLIGQFACPLHGIDDPFNFVLRENCVEHIKTHRRLETIEPVDRLDGEDKSSLGAYTCVYDNFKTDSKTFAEFHVRGAHLGHMIIPENFVGKYPWKEHLNLYFKIDCAKSLVVKGNFVCSLDGATFLNTQLAVRHLVYSHRQQFKDAAKGIVVEGIDKSIAQKVVDLYNKYGEESIGHILTAKHVDMKFLSNEFVNRKTSDQNLNRYFWQFPDPKNPGKFVNDDKCHVNTITAWKHIYNREKIDFFKNKEYSDPVVEAHSNLPTTSKDSYILGCFRSRTTNILTVDLGIYGAELAWVSRRPKFQEFIKKVKKYKLADKNKITDKSLIPNDCK